MIMTGLCEMYSPSFKFFGVRSEFLYVPQFRPSLFMEDEGMPFYCQASQEVLCHGNVSLVTSYIMFLFFP